MWVGFRVFQSWVSFQTLLHTMLRHLVTSCQCKELKEWHGNCLCVCVWFSGEGQDFVLVDAPVSGGVVKAANGSLTVSSLFLLLNWITDSLYHFYQNISVGIDVVQWQATNKIESLDWVASCSIKRTFVSVNGFEVTMLLAGWDLSHCKIWLLHIVKDWMLVKDNG